MLNKPYSVRNLDDLGRVALPADVRAAMGWSKWTLLEIKMGDTGDHVVLRTARLSCFCCGRNSGLKEYRGKHICEACRRTIAGL